MSDSRKIPKRGKADEAARPPAMAYYRHLVDDQQENSIPIQQDQVRQWAEEHRIEVVHEFTDLGKSGPAPPSTFTSPDV